MQEQLVQETEESKEFFDRERFNDFANNIFSFMAQSHQVSES
jgi:hypothetical protein